MKQAILLLLVMFGSFVPSIAQDFDNYIPLRSSGVVPRDFTTLSSTKFQINADNDTLAESELEREIRKQFYLESSFSIDQLLHGGKVIFNDRLSEYVDKVADVILADTPELRKKLRFYVIKSPYVNAFATDGGIIFLNIALLAKADNEAELAFILAHEIMHYVQKHVIKGYVESELVSKDNALGKLSMESRFLSKEKYSRELELEADSLGLMLFLNSPYNTLAADEAMDMLLYSDLPFDEREFEIEFFELGDIELPDKYILEDINEIRERLEDYEDLYSTHPNVAKRRAVLESIVGDSISPTGSFFEVSAAEFNTVQQIARFELCNLWMKEGNYRRAIYSSYILLEDYPDSRYLQKIITKSLYGLTKYSNRDRSHSYLSTLLSRQEEGEISRMNYALKRMKPSEKNITSLFYALEQEDEHEDDEEFTRLVDDLIRELYYYHDGMLERIMDKRKLDEDYESKNSFRMALFEALDENKLMNRFERIEDEISDELSAQFSEWAQGELGLFEETGLGIEKMMVIDPFFWSIDQRQQKKKEVQYLVAEDKKGNFEQLILNNASLAGLEVQILSQQSLNRDEAEKFNDMAILKEFFSEYYMHNGVPMNTYDYTELNRLKEKYGTRYFCWMGAMSIRGRKGTSDYVRFGISALFYPMLPFALTKLLKPKYDTFIFAFVYDVENNESKLMQFEDFPKRDKETLFNSQLYDLFLRIRSSKSSY